MLFSGDVIERGESGRVLLGDVIEHGESEGILLGVIERGESERILLGHSDDVQDRRTRRGSDLACRVLHV